jgi:hypothetical protein
MLTRELEEPAGRNCEVPERAVGVGDGILHDLGDVVEVPPSLRRDQNWVLTRSKEPCATYTLFKRMTGS